MDKRRVGILTWHYFINFGSALQAYAVQRSIEKMGAEATIINYQDPKYSGKPWKDTLRYYIGKLSKFFPDRFAMRFGYPYQQFQKHYMHLTRQAASKDEVSNIARNMDVLVCGSDQIWAPNVFNPIYMMDFDTRPNVRKVSYAASIGLERIPQDKVEQYTRLLCGFDAISVRETKGKNLLMQRCGVDSSVVLDPTLLLDQEEYRVMERCVSGIKQPYIFCYFLNKDHTYRRSVEKYAKENGYAIYGSTLRLDDQEWMHRMQYIGPGEFIWLIEHARAVFTDSYHGTIFSMLFHKPFCVFERFSNNDPICQNSRIEQLGIWFDMKSHLRSADEDICICSAMDSKRFEMDLHVAREASLAYLKGALG